MRGVWAFLQSCLINEMLKHSKMSSSESASSATAGEQPPAGALFLWTVIPAVAFTAALNTLWVWRHDGYGRLRDTGVFRIIRTTVIAAGHQADLIFPDLFHQPHDLTSWRDVSPFLLSVLLVNLLVVVVAAGAWAFGYALLNRVAGGTRGTQLLRWLAVLVPAGAATVILTAAVTTPSIWFVQEVLEQPDWSRLVLILPLGVAVLIGIGLFILLKGASATRRLRYITTAAAAGAAVLCIVALVGQAGSVPVPLPGTPNILLISIDSLRRDHVSAYGYPRSTTPRIDALAQQGVRFDLAVSPTSWTLPSHVTMLTALPARQHNVRRGRQRFSPNVISLAEVLSDAGYETAGFAGGEFLSAVYGFSQGFDHYDDYTVLGRDRRRPDAHITSPLSIELVTRWLRDWQERDLNRPFFAFLHMWDVHADYRPPPPYDTMFGSENHSSDSGTQDPRADESIALYDGEIRWTDSHLGQVFDLLDVMDVSDNTLVVVTSDHGDEFFEHGKKGHGSTLFEEVLLVPLVMRFPKRIPAGRVVEPQVRLIDIAPTILALAGVAHPSGFGYSDAGPYAYQDLTPLIDGRSAVPRLIAFGHLQDELVSARLENSKVIRQRDDPSDRMYFDLSKDPGEQSNLAEADTSETGALLGALLDEWWQAEDPGTASEPAQLSPQQIKILRSLGYLK